MSELDEVVNEIGRSYTKQRIALNEMWKFEFDTPHKRKIMNEQIQNWINSTDNRLEKKK